MPYRGLLAADLLAVGYSLEYLYVRLELIHDGGRADSLWKRLWTRLTAACGSGPAGGG